MHSEKITERYIALLRGINVGGHHKVPMLELKKEFKKMEFKNIITILNSGNIIFDTTSNDIDILEKMVSIQLEKSFGFPIPTIIIKSEIIYELLHDNPFNGIKLAKDTRFYVSFLKKNMEINLNLPWSSTDNSYQIITKNGKTICSVLDFSISKTPKAMLVLDQYFGKNITTRNWNTIKRIENKLKSTTS